MPPIALVNYIEEHLASILKEHSSANSLEKYEAILREYEEQIRGHIRLEQQLKIIIDNLQESIETLENDKKKFEKLNCNLKDEIDTLKYRNRTLESENLSLNSANKLLNLQVEKFISNRKAERISNINKSLKHDEEEISSSRNNGIYHFFKSHKASIDTKHSNISLDGGEHNSNNKIIFFKYKIPTSKQSPSKLQLQKQYMPIKDYEEGGILKSLQSLGNGKQYMHKRKSESNRNHKKYQSQSIVINRRK